MSSACTWLLPSMQSCSRSTPSSRNRLRIRDTASAERSRRGARNVAARLPRGAQQNHTRTPNQAGRLRATCNDALEFAALLSANLHHGD